MKFSVEEVARVLGVASPASGQVRGWSVDTRSIQPGDLFFALRGPNHDGNEFVEQALGKGAVAAVAEHPAKHPEEGPVVVVPDALAALQQLAHWARGVWGGGVVAVTGSAGKTSTKEIIAQVLSVSITVGKNEGNLNNHVGVPLSILRLPEEAKIAVLEMGMNHGGEIRRLAEIAAPDVGVVTNVGYAHIENFGSVDGIAAAKRELIESLPSDGVAVLNADDARVAAFRDAHVGRTITFGLSESADVCAENVEFGEETTSFHVGGAHFETGLAGRHAVLNILAGLAVGGIYDIRPEQAVDVVRRLKPGKMRGERFRHNGILILNDCYNSNPDAARAMVDVLRDTPARRRIAVLGEMLELGRWSETLHRDLGRHVAEQAISVLVGIRGAARAMVDGAVEAGLNSNAAYFFHDPESAGDWLRGEAREGDAILFKGSRGTRVEAALERFLG